MRSAPGTQETPRTPGRPIPLDAAAWRLLQRLPAGAGRWPACWLRIPPWPNTWPPHHPRPAGRSGACPMTTQTLPGPFGPFVERILPWCSGGLLLLAGLWVATIFSAIRLAQVHGLGQHPLSVRVRISGALLPWQWAAYAGTATELLLPSSCWRALSPVRSPCCCFGFNAMAVISYPALGGRLSRSPVVGLDAADLGRVGWPLGLDSWRLARRSPRRGRWPHTSPA